MLVRVSCNRCRLSALWTDDPDGFLATVCPWRRSCGAERVEERRFGRRREERPAVLVVEDDPDARELFGRYLRSHYRVISAQDAAEARLELARPETPVRFVLLDLALPGGEDGIALACWMRSEPRSSRLPIVACTASVAPGVRALALEAGCDDFVAKPLGRLRLLDLVGEALRTHPPLPHGEKG